VFTVEFQKRWLRDAHLRPILYQSCHLELGDVDRIVCAVMPSPLTHSNLYQAIASHTCMMQALCRDDISNSPCIKNTISYKFPKDFSPTMKILHDVFPLWRQRSTTELVMKKTLLKNRCGTLQQVPPDEIQLLINAWVCASIFSVKYVYKGYDWANVVIIDHLNRVIKYLKGECLSSSESILQIFGTLMHDKYHSNVLFTIYL